ncbi:hypothetical protein IQ260_20425 [Leptolyngbya cf. ectocarpi LEGE 11479]|uniref:Uncharacterized protein n=1 Tax=Leptolyngbya cf. ectocarpi LEGE 11479 TaxID=1828722 RepID=A0A928ZX24_LEPEC|nr:hypothetical protein [Leptolyngbya ectocarpi]MBE9069014.1 hypothetical protein [Leptolyngbya cf. ectocarpi LEGE 11479]
MSQQRNLLTVLGCSSSLALVLAVTPSALANPVETQSANDAHSLPTLTQADDNPIMDALSCKCARCVMGQQANL